MRSVTLAFFVVRAAVCVFVFVVRVLVPAPIGQQESGQRVADGREQIRGRHRALTMNRVRVWGLCT